VRAAAGTPERRGRPGGLLRSGREGAAFLAGAATLALTSVHHAYGAIRYGTPERYHAVVIAVAAVAIMAAGLLAHRWTPGRVTGRVGWWVFWLTTAAVPVLLFGGVEGLYNHGVKLVAFHAGVPEATLLRMYPYDIVELPNDFIFEATGVLQVVPAVVAGHHLVRLAARRDRRSR
jgi:hypothetical protein